MHRQWYKFFETLLLQLYIYIYIYACLERRHVLKSTYLKSPKHVRSQLSKPMSLEPNTQIDDFAVLSHTYTIYINHSCYPSSKITYGPLYIILTCQILTMFLTKGLSLVFNTLPSDRNNPQARILLTSHDSLFKLNIGNLISIGVLISCNLMTHHALYINFDSLLSTYI